MAAGLEQLFDARRELAHRATNGIDVFLYWNETTNRVTVEVFDEPSSDGFEFEVNQGHALDAFNHPYAYAGARARIASRLNPKVCAR